MKINAAIYPSDVDGLFVIERHAAKGAPAHFLFFEWKGDDVFNLITGWDELGEGQSILLRELSKIPNFTVWVIRGIDGCPTEYMPVENGVVLSPIDTDKIKMKQLLEEWKQKAELRTSDNAIGIGACISNAPANP